MTQGVAGADADELRQFARDLQEARRELLALKQDFGTGLGRETSWDGPDAFVFRHAWASSYAPVIGNAADMLGEAARRLMGEAVAPEHIDG
ncbi:MAG: hypothetical protein WBX27_12035 [Specibacter sp.]